MRRTYGLDHTGSPVIPPPGWRILPEGSDIPHVHREHVIVPPHLQKYGWSSSWCAPRRCHSTMTPFVAEVSGHVTAFAVPN